MGVSRWQIITNGLLDERFGFSAEDIDYCLRCLEGGKNVLYCGYAQAIHHEGATRGNTPEEKMILEPEIAVKEKESLDFLFSKWYGINFEKFEIGRIINMEVR